MYCMYIWRFDDAAVAKWQFKTKDGKSSNAWTSGSSQLDFVLSLVWRLSIWFEALLKCLWDSLSVPLTAYHCHSLPFKQTGSGPRASGTRPRHMNFCSPSLLVTVFFLNLGEVDKNFVVGNGFHCIKHEINWAFLYSSFCLPQVSHHEVGEN